MTQKFDVSQYELEETGVLDVQNAKGDDALMFDGKPVRFHLYGSGSQQNVRATHKVSNAATMRMQSVLRGKQMKNQTEANDADQIEKLVACTASIENFPITPLDVYSNPKLVYIRRQVEAYLGDDGNFAKPSANS